MSLVLPKFLKYVQIDTQSDDKSTLTPSTLKQFDLAKVLVEELHELGIKNAHVDEFGIVYASIEGNKENVPSLGLIAHMDTALEMPGINVKPRVIENYDGKDIKLSDSIVMKVEDFPILKEKIGKTLVVTDGNTLLGGDDKAGIAIIMALCEFLMKNKDFPHGDIKIAFTPDEEIGRGTENLDVKKFGAKFAYTVDGGPIFDVEYENFNAASAVVKVKGVSIHPGSAKDKMINSMTLGMEFHSLLPKGMVPELTSGYEGFNHLIRINGNVDETVLEYIIRNHDAKILEDQKADFIRNKNFLNEKYRRDLISVEIKDTYKNMKDYLKDQMYIVDIAKEAISLVGLTPSSHPIRGGTDGANLTYMGLPCPNIGTGNYNAHGRYEFVVVEELEQMVEIVKNIVSITANKKW